MQTSMFLMNQNLIAIILNEKKRIFINFLPSDSGSSIAENFTGKVRVA